MTYCLQIEGGIPLLGTVQISGAKNAALPILLSSLLTSEQCQYLRIPNLEDVHLTCHLLESLGATLKRKGSEVQVCCSDLVSSEASYSIVKALRASFWVLAPLLARTGKAQVSLPGGDIIGARPVDIHLEGLTKMGADIRLKHGTVIATAPRGLKPCRFELRFPSVGATHQLLMAAALTPGTSVFSNVAREPEVVALAEVLQRMGAAIEGAGSKEIIVHGVPQLSGVEVSMIGDRIEAGTYLLAAAATGGKVRATGIDPLFFGSALDAFEKIGLTVSSGADYVEVQAPQRLKPAQLTTAPFPGLATDLQALFMAALSFAEGESQIEENIFEGRFGHVSELCRLGAKITVEDRTAHISGVNSLTGAIVEGHDIRAAAALVIAALGAEGTTHLLEIQHLRRGYDGLEQKLQGLGARVRVIRAENDDEVLIGC